MQLQHAYDQWTDIVGSDHIRTGPGNSALRLPDVAECRPRDILAVLTPGTKEDLAKVISVADRCLVPVYPISRGKNCALGSKKPVRSNAAVLDLHRLDRITSYNEELGYVTVEPGVTVDALCAFLKSHNSELVPNVGGASGSASMIGNILERGSGSFGVKRIDSILALEAILASGKLVRTGHWNMDSSANEFTHVYPYGYGPDLRGLFIQSNLGVVTQMAIKLPSKKRRIILEGKVDRPSFHRLVDTFAMLRRHDVLGTGIKFYANTDRRPCIGMVTLAGSYNMMLAAKDDIVKLNNRHHKICLTFYDTADVLRDDADTPDWIHDLSVKLTEGTIGKHHYLTRLRRKRRGLPKLDLSNDIDAVENKVGIMCVNVAVPFLGEAAEEVVRTLGQSAPDYTVGFSDLGDYCIKGHAGILFDRTSKSEVAKARAQRDAAFRDLERAGFYPQRLDIDTMDYYNQRYGGEYRDVLRALKIALDPNQIISPSRYVPEC